LNKKIRLRAQCKKQKIDYYEWQINKYSGVMNDIDSMFIDAKKSDAK
jgi:midasin (ATPase involved in ribosome maturation)